MLHAAHRAAISSNKRKGHQTKLPSAIFARHLGLCGLGGRIELLKFDSHLGIAASDSRQQILVESKGFVNVDEPIAPCCLIDSPKLKKAVEKFSGDVTIRADGRALYVVGALKSTGESLTLAWPLANTDLVVLPDNYQAWKDDLLQSVILHTPISAQSLRVFSDIAPIIKSNSIRLLTANGMLSFAIKRDGRETAIPIGPVPTEKTVWLEFSTAALTAILGTIGIVESLHITVTSRVLVLDYTLEQSNNRYTYFLASLVNTYDGE